MEEEIKSVLKTDLFKKAGRAGGGSINFGERYETDRGQVYVKQNSKSEARRMFDGEFEGLKAIKATNTVRVPTPLMVVDNPKGGAGLVMEYLEMSSLHQFSAKLGQQLARMHLHNQNLLIEVEKQKSYVGQQEGVEPITKFGFHCVTCCGYLPQDNTWCDDWVEFYMKQKLQAQIDLIEETHGDRELRELWPKLQRVIPELFKNIQVKPALLHGDLWGGNAAEISEGPVIYDPATFYGHSEFELGIAKMFGGFSTAFYNAYHELIPKEAGFDLRNQLYQLFHNLNHWYTKEFIQWNLCLLLP